MLIKVLIKVLQLLLVLIGGTGHSQVQLLLKVLLKVLKVLKLFQKNLRNSIPWGTSRRQITPWHTPTSGGT